MLRTDMRKNEPLLREVDPILASVATRFRVPLVKGPPPPPSSQQRCAPQRLAYRHSSYPHAL